MTSRLIKPGLITIAAFFIMAGVLGQDLTFKLKEAQDYTVKNNYKVKNARLDLEIARNLVKENLSYGFPQVNASVDYSYFIALPTSLIPGEFLGKPPGEYVELKFGTKNNLTGGVTLNQLIFDGRYFIGLQYAKIFEQLSTENLEKSEQDVKETVAQTYFNILVGQEALKVLDSTLAILEKTRYETSESYKEGFTEKTDYDQLTLTVTDIQNSINSTKRQNELGYQLLKYQMGINPDQPVTLRDNLEGLIEQASADAILDQPFNLEQHIDYRLITSQEKMKILGLKNEKAAYYPSLKGYIFVQENAQRNQFNFLAPNEPWFLTSSTGVSMQIPIFSSGYRRSKISQAKLDLEKIRNTKEQVATGIKLSIDQLKAEFRKTLENYLREKQNVDLSLEIYKNALTKYHEGVATSVELTQQHNQFFTSESKYFNTVLSLLNAKNMLDKALGNY